MVKYGLLDSFQPQEAVLVFTDNQSPGSSGCSGFFCHYHGSDCGRSHLRGCIYRFKSKLQPYAAMLLSACVFRTNPRKLNGIRALTFVGFLLAYSYEKERNLLVPIFYHGLFNCLTLSMITLHVLSGNELPY